MWHWRVAAPRGVDGRRSRSLEGRFWARNAREWLFSLAFHGRAEPRQRVAQLLVGHIAKGFGDAGGGLGIQRRLRRTLATRQRRLPQRDPGDGLPAEE